jgi:serralysin
MPTITQNPTITVDGNFSDWVSSELITTPGNFIPGYSLYGTVQNDTYFIGIDATSAPDPVIGAGTTIWLNTDQNTATGYTPFDSIGADYNITLVNGAFYLYTGAAGQNLVSATPLSSELSLDGKSLEIAIPRGLVTPAGASAPTNINILGQIDTGTSSQLFLPGDYNNPQYTIIDPATLVTEPPTHKVAIVYSDTSANLYFNQTAYSDLFMAAQNQARMAGVSYDVIDESQLTNINNLIGYDAIIFPSMADVNTAQLPAIMSTLTSAVYNYHIGLITAGDFLTNDQTGAALPGNSYSNMETLLGLARVSGGNAGAITVTANDVTNPIMKSYTAGQVIQTYPSEGYTAYQGVGGVAPDVLVNQDVTGVGTLPGVVQTTTGGTNVHFATTDLLGDSNLLSNAIQSVVLGTQPGVVLHMSRDAGVVAVRMDMDQSQFPADVSPVGANGVPLPPGNGIYDKLIPILQQWNQQYDFVGSYYINIGDNATAADPSTTVWAKSLPYYQAIQAMGSEIGAHSYTHLINPPTTTVTETTVGDTPVGSTQITLSALPSFAGVTVGMFVTGGGLGTNTPLPGAAGEGGSIANTQVTAVSGNTITISYVPGGYGTANNGTLADIPAGTILTFSIPAENTNFLQTATVGAVTGSIGDPFTYDYEFNQSRLLEQQKLGTTIYGAAIPGATETFATDQNILPYFQSVAPSATTPGYIGYLTGGWTGIGSGYPSAIGYMSPSATDMGALYIAPNMTFDFTEIQYQGKTVAQAEADWAAQFNALTANAAGTPVVVLPVHDYGVAAWNTTTDSATGSPYTTQMYAGFIAQAYADNYEFLTLEELAARTEAQQKATINYTTAGNTITATVTPDPTAPDLGGMALDVVNGGTQVIKNVTNWYAYNAQEVFLPKSGGNFTVNLGATQDAVTHIASLPMRCDLLSCTGNGLDLKFSAVGNGQVVVDLGNLGTQTPVVTLTTGDSFSVSGNVLDLSLVGLGQHDVTIGTTLSAPSVPVLAAASDSGLSNSDDYTNVTLPTITGTYVAGDMVTLFEGTTQIAAGVVSATGQWTVTATTKLTDGVHNITAQASDGYGDVSPMSAALAVTVDTVAPTPTNLALASALEPGGNNITGVTTPSFTGDGEANGVITVYDRTTVLGTGTIAADGTWSVTDTVPLARGVHSITAAEVDRAGNIGTASAGLSVTIDTAPSVGGVTALPPDAILGEGATATLTVGMGQAVTVSGGTPTLTLNNGGIASYASGSGTDSLTFKYTVEPKQDVSQLAVTGINPNGATVTDQLGAAANFSHVAITPPGWLQIAPSAIAAFDTSTQTPVPVLANHYTGPVANVQAEYINISSDNLNISASTPNWFIHSGSGMDAIAVSSGTNVLDGGTGSNFLVGGSGSDTFFVDDRGAAADIWSTVAGFHQGDAATIWGVTPQDFNLGWVDGQGADGYTGLTLHATAATAPPVSLTLAGYTQADLTNGRLTVQFGTDAASGSAYMYIHGNA